jgi:hypothetical protein
MNSGMNSSRSRYSGSGGSGSGGITIIISY